MAGKWSSDLLKLLGDKTELQRVTDNHGKEEGDDGPGGVAHALADGLNDDYGEEDAEREKKTVRNEIAGGSGSESGSGPVKIEGVQKAADCEDGQKEQELDEGEEGFLHEDAVSSMRLVRSDAG